MISRDNALEIAGNIIPVACPHAAAIVEQVADAVVREYHRGAADALDREADWIERRGEQKGSDLASRGVVAMGLRMAAQRHREQAVESPDDTEEFCPDCFAGMESSEHHEKCGPS